MKIMQTLRSKKGFTLMELIIVIVILAILAAALIPTFIGFARNARASTAIANARVGITAAQSILTHWAAGQAPGATVTNDNFNRMLRGVDSQPFTSSNAGWGNMFTTMLAEDGLVPTRFGAFTLSGNRVTGVVFASGEFLVTIAGGNSTYIRDPINEISALTGGPLGGGG
ncbi:MAG: prepilin-type N-terminal cleavage/methylation domain-containing protein [Oscillospiraceae bacterium]|jgi:prepilin-type N-terminal cleavage/methylation domain-containing protein|nr:prepilin-type N-terminal cleavage/methylation domain-containing protein [Oscillospiraceae bacterium]